MGEVLRLAPRPGTAQIGDVIGHYRLTRVIGRGGMAVVFEGINDQIEKRAAIKMLLPQFASNPELRTRFLNEARSVNQVQHAGIVNIFEFGETIHGHVFIVMEYLDGDPLHIYMQRRTLLIPDLLRIGRQLAAALTAVHRKGIVHRDLKPSNVLIISDSESLGGERVKLLDFGVAKMIRPADAGASLFTAVGTVLGTPSYMAPEQWLTAAAVDDRADVYSLGVLLYQALGGRLPFVAATPGELMSMHINREPTPLQTINPTVSPEVSQLVHAMLAKRSTDRPSMSQVEQELAAACSALALPALTLADQEPRWTPSVISISVSPAVPPRASWRSRVPGMLLGGALGAAILLGGAMAVVLASQRAALPGRASAVAAPPPVSLSAVVPALPAPPVPLPPAPPPPPALPRPVVKLPGRGAVPRRPATPAVVVHEMSDREVPLLPLRHP